MNQVLLPSLTHAEPRDKAVLETNRPVILTNMLGLEGQGIVQLAGMLHDQVSLQVIFDGRDATITNKGDSPVMWAFHGTDIPQGVSRFNTIKKNHLISVSSPILVLFFVVGVHGETKTAELQIFNEVTLRVF